MGDRRFVGGNYCGGFPQPNPLEDPMSAPTPASQSTKKVGGFIAKRHDLRRVVTNLAVLDFNSPDNSMQLVSVHPGVSVDDVVANTGFELVIPANVPVSRPPTAEESAAIEAIDPKGLRHREIPA